MTVDMSGLGIAETATKVREALYQLSGTATIPEGKGSTKPMNEDGGTLVRPQAESCISRVNMHR